MSKNNAVVSQARAVLDQFKPEAAKEVGVNLKQGYNGDLVSKEAGSVGGRMVKQMIFKIHSYIRLKIMLFPTHVYDIINLTDLRK